MQRPDLSRVDPSIRRYIESLEAKLGISVEQEEGLLPAERLNEVLPSEPETTIGLLTLSKAGQIKRTFRHFYSRQHRGGMGVFDLDTNPPDFPALLGLADENQTLLLITSKARVFRHTLQTPEKSPVRSKGFMILNRIGLEPDETIKSILPEQARGYIAFLSESGRVRCLRHHMFGEHMRPGTSIYSYPDFGPLSSACWTTGDGDLFIVTRNGIGIRFPEKAISPQGDLGIRLSHEDIAIGIASTYAENDIFILGADGKGTIRQMNGFTPNKTPGGSGKIAFKNSQVIGASMVNPEDELFIITRLGKIIRFVADEIPVTDGVVQGVNCISLRADEVTAFIRSTPR